MFPPQHLFPSHKRGEVYKKARLFGLLRSMARWNDDDKTPSCVVELTILKFVYLKNGLYLFSPLKIMSKNLKPVITEIFFFFSA